LPCKADRLEGQGSACSTRFLRESACRPFYNGLLGRRRRRDFVAVTGRPGHAQALHSGFVPTEIYLPWPELLCGWSIFAISGRNNHRSGSGDGMEALRRRARAPRATHCREACVRRLIQAVTKLGNAKGFGQMIFQMIPQMSPQMSQRHHRWLTATSRRALTQIPCLPEPEIQFLISHRPVWTSVCRK